MAGNSRNFMIKFGADSKSVSQAIRQINSDTRAATALATEASKAFVFTGDSSALDNSMSRIRSSIKQTESVAGQLRKQLSDGMATGKISEGSVEYGKLKRAIDQADTSALKLKNQLQEASDVKAPDASKWGGISKGIGKMSGAMSSFVGNLGANAVSSAVGTITGSLGEMAKDAISDSDQITKFSSTMKGAHFGTKEIKQASKEMKKYADDTVYDTGDIMSMTAKLAANGTKNYTTLTKAAGNLNSQFGGNADTFKSVGQAITQTAGAGKLTTDNWNQLTDAVPGAAKVLQDAMKKNGAYTGNFRDAMADGKVSSDEFNKAITQLGMNPGAVKAAKSTNTFEGAMGALKSAGTNAILKIIQTIGMSNITGAIKGITSFVEKLSDKFQELATKYGPAVTKAFKLVVSAAGKIAKISFKALTDVISFIVKHKDVFGTLAAAITPIVAAFVAWTTAIKIWQAITQIATAVQWAFNAAMDANPIGVIVMAIAALVAGLIYFFTQTKLGQEIWSNFTKMLTDFWNALPGLITTVVNSVVTFFTSLPGNIWNAIKSIGSFIGNLIGSWLKAIPGLIGELLGWYLSLPFKIWNAIKAIAGFIGSVLGSWIAAIPGLFMRVVNFYISLPGRIWEGMKAIAGFIGSVLGSWVKAIPGIFDSIVGWFKSLPGKIWDAIKGIGSIGANLVNGLWKGITGMGGWLNDKIKGFGKSFISGFKKTFSIHSPSKVMRDEIGKYIALGIGKGVTDYSDEAVSPVNEIKNRMIGMSDDIQLNPPNVGTLYGIGGLPEGTGGNGDSYTINVNGYGANDKQGITNAVNLALRQNKLIR